MSVTRKKYSTMPTCSSLSKINNSLRKKSKPGWDSTNSNLEQHKITQEEIVNKTYNCF